MTAQSPQACAADFTAALIGRDMDAALALLADDAVLFYSNGAALHGKTAFAETMTAAWKVVSDYQYSTLNPVWISQTEDAACLIYGFSWSGVAGGQKVSGGGRGTRVFRKGPAGWLIAHEHLSMGKWAAGV